MSVTTKILVIRLSSIGDVVLTTPIVRCLKNQLHGECEIHFLIKKQFAPLLDGNPYISKIHTVEDNLKKVTEELKEEGFHYIVDLHKNFRSFYVRRRLKVLSFDFRKLNIQKWILVNFKIDLLPDIHIVDRYFEAVKALGIVNDGKGLDFFIPEDQKVDIPSRFGLEENKYLVIAIGGAHEGKKLPVARLKELCQLVEHSTILIGGKEDGVNGESIAKGLNNVINTCGELGLHESASVISQSRLVVSHDSGMMHIAAALGKKIISIWGATVPKFGMYPYLPHPDSLIIQAEHLKFRPTSKLGNKNSKRERRTMEEIDLNSVKSAINQLWNSVD